jgi:phosphatidylglycerol:prolipoprotein diacylglycerol transferase
LEVHWYGVMIALGFLAGIWTANRRALAAGIDPERITNLLFWLLLAGIVGARVLYVVTYWREEFSGRPFSKIFSERAGLVFHGGLIAATLVTFCYLRVKRLPFWKTIDVLAPSVALGHAFGRVGCFMTGCCYGTHSDWPWAVRFPAGHARPGELLHPVQLYEAIGNLLIAGALAWLHRRRRFDGQVFAVYLMSYGLLRGVMEIFRADNQLRFFGGRISTAQMISAAMVIAGVALWRRLQNRGAGGLS